MRRRRPRMKGFCGKIAARIFIIFLIVLISGCVAGQQAGKPERAEGNMETLLVEDIGRGSSVSAFWCGNDGIIVHNEKIGVELIKISDAERISVSPNGLDHPLNCSPDGKWIVYMDRASTRPDKADRVFTAEDYGLDPELDVWPVWEGYVADLYRYETATGRRQRFAVARSELPEWEVISPDGAKVFLGGARNSSIDMPEPRWEALLFSAVDPKDWDWNHTDARWFKDSSGVVRAGNGVLYVEIFGDHGWAKRLAVNPKPKDGIFALSVDTNNRIYFLANDEVPSKPWTKHFLYRCKVADKELSCEVIHAIDEYVSQYVVLPGGDVLYRSDKNNCIYRVTPRRQNGECITGKAYEEKGYNGLSLIGVSPDGKRLAFSGYKKTATDNGDFAGYKKKDLFVIKLSD